MYTVLKMKSILIEIIHLGFDFVHENALVGFVTSAKNVPQICSIL